MYKLISYYVLIFFASVYLGKNRGVQTSIVYPTQGAGAGQGGCGGGWGLSYRVGGGFPLLIGKNYKTIRGQNILAARIDYIFIK